MSDWLLDNFGWCLVALTLGLAGLITWICVSESRSEDRFMLECQQDHKRYECEALWRSGQKGSTMPVVIPAPVIVR